MLAPRALAALSPILLFGALLAPAPASAAAPDWSASAAEDTVVVVTKDADGSLRETTIWIAVVDGQGYIRTGNTRWEANIERDPDLVLRMEGAEYPVRAEFVEDEALRARIQQAFHEKYGFTDTLAGMFHAGHPKLMRLVPRKPPEAARSEP